MGNNKKGFNIFCIENSLSSFVLIISNTKAESDVSDSISGSNLFTLCVKYLRNSTLGFTAL